MPTVTRTHTRTHVYVKFADPYLTCDECGGWVTSWHDPDRCGDTEDERSWNLPCEHTAGTTSECPSWGPVNGCQCLAHLGYVDHEEPPRTDA